ncbi:nuclear transport factor 2 family protein [Streptomyces xiamenensis]
MTHTPELDVEIRQFYARQLLLLDSGDFTGFGTTFTDTGTFHPAGGGTLHGPAAIATAAERAAERFRGAQPRHWFDMMTITATDDAATIDTRYYAAVTVTAKDGSVLMEPTCLVEDTLVRATDGTLRSRSRTINRDDLR